MMPRTEIKRRKREARAEHHEPLIARYFRMRSRLRCFWTWPFGHVMVPGKAATYDFVQCPGCAKWKRAPR